ncbi:hypothetical protein DL240_14890 [Lujinxingia litoralis]|uniref:Sporulation stage II protein D amidase enhancer LytB N-terminal domain-containing protein n=1 Tax=Lujinxingia litoralis TaxID=2211119 RepID=A0A328C4M9_9DELT|nr:carboxypeptidase regulatory-like domain-containing protein [Lujinxingia litoralis]RAL20954.1 hypothetical protein DL240_14890 [Lujinxingia litoralis]
MRALFVALVALVMMVYLPAASAGELSGRLADGWTDTPIAGATIEVLGLGERTTTDAHGRWTFDLPEGVYELSIAAPVFGEIHASRLVHQRVPQVRPARAHVYTSEFHDRGATATTFPVGLPSFSGRINDPAGPMELWRLLGNNPSLASTFYEIPPSQPPIIRVGRRSDPTGRQGCTDASNPIVAINEMTLDEYVKGVLPPEIGVFRSLPGASEVYKAFAIAARSYGLWFVLRYGPGNRRELNRALPPHNYTWFHIDDTACNQRYDDQRLTITTDAAEAVSELIMVKRGETSTIDKYEYAASCGRHGSRPAYQSALVPDQPPTDACAGSWCGHGSCAAHEDNPNVPGSDRCLVRGICQWGAISWAGHGRDYTWLLVHYQPNTELRTLSAANSDPAVRLTGYVYEDPDNIIDSVIAGATVTLSDGQQTTSGANGVYTFEAVLLSETMVTIEATAPGYLSASRDKDLVSGVTNWGSIRLERDPSPNPEEPSDAGDSNDSGDPGDVGIPSDTETSPGSDSDTPSPRPPGPTQEGEMSLLSASTGVSGGCQAMPGYPGIPALFGALGFMLVALRRRLTRAS